MQGVSGRARAGRCAPLHWGGFSLVELLIVIVLAAGAAAVAAPIFAEWHARDRVDRAARALLASLTFARGEALARGSRVAVCPVAGAARCVPASQGCALGAWGWSCGWGILAEPEHVGPALQRHRYAALRMYPQVPGVAISATAARVEFTPPAGQVIGGFSHFEIAAVASPAGAQGDRLRRCLRIAAGGRPRLERGGCGKRDKT